MITTVSESLPTALPVANMVIVTSMLEASKRYNRKDKRLWSPRLTNPLNLEFVSTSVGKPEQRNEIIRVY